MPLTCPSCGNDRNFLVKTLQMHVVQLREDSRVEASEEGRPAVIEVLCDECEKGRSTRGPRGWGIHRGPESRRGSPERSDASFPHRAGIPSSADCTVIDFSP